MTDGNICSSDVWRQISDAQSAVGKLKRKRERCRMERLKFIGKRLVYLVIMLFGVATLVFILKNFDYPEKPLKYKHIRRISD